MTIHAGRPAVPPAVQACAAWCMPRSRPPGPLQEALCAGLVTRLVRWSPSLPCPLAIPMPTRMHASCGPRAPPPARMHACVCAGACSPSSAEFAYMKDWCAISCGLCVAAPCEPCMHACRASHAVWAVWPPATRIRSEPGPSGPVRAAVDAAACCTLHRRRACPA